MKKIIVTLIASVILGMTVFSQTKAVASATIKTPNALCQLCKDRIETYLKRYDGVLEINVNYHKGETKVKYVTDRINIEEIKTAIANCGYDADDIPATEDAYKRLPKTCKKPEDGGPTKAPNIHAPPVVKQ